MKKNTLNLILLFILTFHLSAQKNNMSDIAPIADYKGPIAGRFINENIYFASKDFHWKYVNINIVNVSWFSEPRNFFRTDLLGLGNQFLSSRVISVYSFDYPMNIKKSNSYVNLFYIFPIGLRLPVLSGRNYDLSASCDYYWPINSSYEEHDSMYYVLHTPGAITTFKKVPQILDLRLNLNLVALKYAGISVFGGYRNQLTRWYATDFGISTFSKNITGAYFGFSLSLSGYLRTNKGLEAWNKAKTNNTYSAYSSFLSGFPGSHYEKEARQRKEDACYLAATNGGLDECRLYMKDYPKGKYVEKVKKLLDETEKKDYDNAVIGSISDCEKYLRRYPEGRYTEDVKKLIIVKQDQIETDIYKKAVAGTVSDCNNYLEKYPSGKYVREVTAEKENKIETRVFEAAINGTIESCDYYLKEYPEGKYVSDVISLRKVKLEKAEENSYNAVLAGVYEECEKYLILFPDGKHIREVDLLCRKMKYDKNAPTQILELIDPEIDKIEILKKNFSGDINFKYNVVVFSQYGSQVFVRADRSIPTIELVIVPLMDNMVITSSFGKPNTRMDISLMKQGFEYNNKIWYPTAERDALIICVQDKIMVYNVRYVNKKVTPAQK